MGGRPGRPATLPAIPKQQRRPAAAAKSKWRRAAGRDRRGGGGAAVEDPILAYLQAVECSPELFEMLWRVGVTESTNATKRWSTLRAKMQAVAAFTTGARS